MRQTSLPNDEGLFVTCAGKISHIEQIFKNEFFLFLHSPLKYLQIDA